VIKCLYNSKFFSVHKYFQIKTPLNPQKFKDRTIHRHQPYQMFDKQIKKAVQGVKSLKEKLVQKLHLSQDDGPRSQQNNSQQHQPVLSHDPSGIGMSLQNHPPMTDRRNLLSGNPQASSAALNIPSHPPADATPADTNLENQESVNSTIFESELSEDAVAILVEFVPIPDRLQRPPRFHNRAGGPVIYNPGDSRRRFISNTRYDALNQCFGPAGMTIDGAIKLYVVWDQGSDEVISPVDMEAQFRKCILLMAGRLWKDRFQLVYVEGRDEESDSGPSSIDSEGNPKDKDKGVANEKPAGAIDSGSNSKGKDKAVPNDRENNKGGPA
jgi:hypothetical protein